MSTQETTNLAQKEQEMPDLMDQEDVAIEQAQNAPEPAPVSPYDHSVTKRNAYWRGNKASWMLILFVLASLGSVAYWRLFFKPAEAASGVDKIVFQCAVLSNELEPEVLSCNGDASDLVRGFKEFNEFLEEDILCTKHIMQHGNEAQAMVETDSGAPTLCWALNNPAAHERRVILGQKHAQKYLDGDRDFLAKGIQKMNDDEYQQKTLSTSVLVKREVIAYSKENIAQLENGKKPSFCFGPTHRKIVDKFMCSHVIRNQLPQTSHCYNRNDKRQVNPIIKDVINAFERGNITLPEEEAKLAVFTRCAAMLSDKFLELDDFERVDLFQEREKRAINGDGNLIEKCRKF